MPDQRCGWPERPGQLGLRVDTRSPRHGPLHLPLPDRRLRMAYLPPATGRKASTRRNMSGGKVFRSPASSATLRSLVMLSGASCPAEMAAEGSGHRALQGGAARGRLPSRTAVWLRRGRPRRLESLPAALFVVGDAEHAVLGPISSRNCSRGQIGGLLHSALPAASLPAEVGQAGSVMSGY